MHHCPPLGHLAPSLPRRHSGRRRVAVLLNLRARRVDGALLARCQALVGPAHVYASRSLGEAEHMARQVVHGRYDVVACGGGDGTLTATYGRLRRYVAEANAWRRLATSHGRSRLAAWQVPSLAFLALGTGNAVRNVVGNGSPVSDVTRLLYDDQLAALEVPVIAMAGGGHFLFGGMGFDSLLLDDYRAFVADHPAPLLKSLLGYVAAAACRTLPRICGSAPLLHARVKSVGRAWYIDPHTGDTPVPLGRDRALFAGHASLLAVGTIAYLGFGLRIFPFASAVPNTMHLRIASLSASRVLRALPQLWRGTLRDPSRLRDFAAEGVAIELTHPFAFQHSGDAQGSVSSLQLTIAPDAMRLVSFLSPSAAALAAS